MIKISQSPRILNTSNVSFASKVKEDKTNVSKENKGDTFEMQDKNNKKDLSIENKQQIISKARSKAAGWSILFGVFSTLYYGLRSDKTVAKRFDLDKEKDQKLIKKIKRDQMLATLPGALTTALGGVIAYIYCKNQDADKISVE